MRARPAQRCGNDERRLYVWRGVWVAGEPAGVALPPVVADDRQQPEELRAVGDRADQVRLRERPLELVDGTGSGRGMGDDLGDHRVIEGADHRPADDPGVHSYALDL